MLGKSLQGKAIGGIVWAAFQRGGSLVIGFVGNIVLARLLSPEDYGCIGLLLIFTSIADILIDGGLGSALIQKKEIKVIDCSTIFVSNLIISIFLFSLLFLLSPLISDYFHIPILKDILRVESVAIILRALYIIPLSLANRNLEFKKIAIITIGANSVSVLISILLAYIGFGVWSLVAKNVILQCSLCVLFWLFEKWKISLDFSFSSFKSLFKYGFFVAFSNLIENIFANVESFIIGRRYKPTTLGYYSQAKSLGQVPIYSISMVVNQVLFPTLSKLQDQKDGFVKGIRKSIVAITFVAFPIIILFGVLSEQIIVFLYSDRWIASVPFLQIVCVTGLINSVLHSNFSVLKALGSSKMFLISQVILSSLKIIFLLFGMRYGVIAMLCGHALGTYIGCGILMHLSGRFTHYGLKEQLKDICPALLLALTVGLLSYTLIGILNLSNILIILVVSLIYMMLYLMFSRLFNLKGFTIYKNIIFSKQTK